MPHLVVPLLLALAVLPMARRQIILWAPMVWVPDLDFFFAKEYHRALLSNIWIPLALVGALLWLWRRRDPTSRLSEFMFRPGAPGGLFLSAYYFAGHILMDIFAGGVALFWPLSTYSPYLFLSIRVNTATGETDVVGEGGTPPDIPEITPVYEWFSTIDAAMLTLVAVVALVVMGRQLWMRAKAPSPVRVKTTATLHSPIQKG